MFLVYVVFTGRNDVNWILKILWTYLHLRSLHRVAVTFPMVPCHSLTTDLSVKVQTIQVGVVAIVVPPGAFAFHGTIVSTGVIITIFGGKWISSVITKGISSSTLKNDNNLPIGQFISVTYPRRTGGKRRHIFAWTTWPKTLWPRGIMRPRD